MASGGSSLKSGAASMPAHSASAAPVAAASPNASAASLPGMRHTADLTLGTWLSLGSFEEVFNSDLDYWEVNMALKKSGMTLVKILKIHNGFLTDRFDEELKLMKRIPDFEPNFQYLYHGTGESLERICQEGLDERTSTEGHFGRGIYFSDNPEFCRIYSEARSPAEPFIIRCKVILGDCKVYPSGQCDAGLTREPEKENISGRKTYFHSLLGQPGQHKQFVVFEKRKVLIQYVIYYSTNSPLPRLPPIPAVVSKSHRSKHRRRSTERRPSTSSLEGACGGVSDGHSSISSSDNDSVSSADGDTKKVAKADGKAEKRSSLGKDDVEATKASPIDRGDVETASDSKAPVVKSVRNRTRRLVGTASSDGTTAPNPAGMESGCNEFRKEMQEKAMKQMLDLKGKVPKSDMEELFSCYSRTYGGGAGASLSDEKQIEPTPTALSIVSEASDDVQLVMDALVANFQEFVGSVDPTVAGQFIIQNGMDLERAISAYLDMLSFSS